MHSINLALRFFLEIAALSGFGVFVWSLFDGKWRYLALVIALGVLMALWGIFAVPGDPSRSGGAPIPVPGILRLMLELVILLGGAYAYYQSGYSLPAAALTILVILHYALSGERIMWLLQQ